MTTASTIHYATPLRPAKLHSRVGIAAFALGAFAAGSMLLCVLAVSFPLMSAPGSWEVPAAIFGLTMFGSWVISFVLAVVGVLQRGMSRLYPTLAFVMVVLAVLLAAVFVSVA